MEHDANLHKRRLNYSGNHGFAWEENDQPEDFLIYQSTTAVIEQRSRQELEDYAKKIFGKDFSWYLRVSWLPALIMALIGFSISFFQLTYFYFWLIAGTILMVVYLAIICLQKFHSTRQQLMMTAILAGLLAGFSLAFFEFLWYFKEAALVNLLFRPAQLMLIAWLMSWLISLIFINHKKYD